jgi:hypothetical protein
MSGLHALDYQGENSRPLSYAYCQGNNLSLRVFRSGREPGDGSELD